jgi:hypothetical protein
MNDLPVLRHDRARIHSIGRALSGNQIRSASYLQSAFGGYETEQLGRRHQVDFEIALTLSDGILGITWGRDDLVAGLGVWPRGPLGPAAELVVTDGGEAWQELKGKVVENVHFAWHVSDSDSPPSLWSMRLAFASGRNVVIALGELDSTGVPTYHPDSLVVLFEESDARSYVMTETSGSAWAMDHES